MSRRRRSVRRASSRRPQRRPAQRRKEVQGGIILAAGIVCLICFLGSYVVNTLWAGMIKEKVGGDLDHLTSFSREVRSDLTRQVARNAQFALLGQRMEESIDRGDDEAPEYVQTANEEPEQDVMAETEDVTED